MIDLQGKKALITGAGRGLGRGMATGLYKAGAEIVILDILEDVFKTSAEMEENGAKVHSIICDLSNRENRIEGFEKALELLGGKIDILVNAAGIIDRFPAIDLPMETWDKVLEVNLTAVMDLSRLAARQMVPQKSGKIINVASMHSFFGGFNVTTYASSKGGVAQLTKALSNQLAIDGIQVNAIAPGFIQSFMTSHHEEDPELYAQLMSRIPTGRLGQPEDLEGITMFLASNLSNYITGTVIPVDGGYLVR
ncbi:SDR family oxidoreductase [Psychrobacillus sp. OK032]|uniref:SDR family oxidoreductase n=1 Tax=Psychrobacillus sp. OK032 TaxID=1884358 RepID=UPI0008AC0AB6|nr:SDR family oxidoreductase [Psychrobacillus sp. OK032]SER69818.1 2-deoxy-D-gluconate 3-dehydrogenase [Psychrobacillus sp. OK032]